MRSYPKYKPSGIDWIGEIPDSWIICKIRKVLNTLTDFSANGSFADLAANVQYLDKPDYSRLVRLTDLREGLRNDGIYVSKEAHEYLSKSALFGGEILMANVGAYAGLVCLVPKINFVATLAPNMFLLKFHKQIISNQYAFILLGSDPYCKTLANIALSSAQPKLNKEDIRSVDLIFPSLSEQQQIADFLNHKTGQCDRFIRNRQKQIELLNEQLRFKINQAITKGINSKVKFKATDIKYVPEIPDHWDIRKFKSLTSILTCGVAATPEYVEKHDGVLFLSAQNVKPFRMVFDKLAYIKPELHEKLTRNKKPIKGDVLVTRIGGDSNIGDACVVSIDSEFSVYVSLTHIRPNKEILSEYIVYFFNTEYCYQLNHEGTVVAGGQGNLNVKNVERYRIPLPPVEEQKEIITYLDNYRKEIDNLISKYQKQIELMQEYRTALISQAVTGKIDVRDWKPQTK